MKWESNTRSNWEGAIIIANSADKLIIFIVTLSKYSQSSVYPINLYDAEFTCIGQVTQLTVLNIGRIKLILL